MSDQKIKFTIKLLTPLVVLFSCFQVWAANFSQESTPTHLRWNLFAQRDSLMINKSQNIVYIRSLSPQLINEIFQSIDENRLNERYIQSVVLTQDRETNIHQIKVELRNSDVELFSFYVDRDQKYVMDFWSNAGDLLEHGLEGSVQEVAEVESTDLGDPVGSVDLDALQRQSELEAQQRARDSARENEVENVTVRETTNLKENTALEQKVKRPEHRDFRYGASFLWGYSPLAPRISQRIDLTRKTPEHFYPIQDRDYEKNEMEAHLQLTINLYRRRNFGLMYKSIQLFQEKYDEKTEFELIEYLKANALLRESLNRGQREPVKTALAMLSNVAEKTSDYELKKAIYNFLITNAIESKDHVRALDLSKRLYVESTENYDFEESVHAAEVMLYSLAQLNQIEDIRELVQDRAIQQALPSQVLLSYKYYSMMNLGQYEEVVKDYERNKPGLSRPIHPSLLFNVAEAYFQNAQYDQAISLFDMFVNENSHIDRSSDARLRLAMSYELLNRDFGQVLELYRHAINRSTRTEITREARIRYAAATNLRKYEPTDADKELRILLDFNNSRDLGEGSLSAENQRLLWLTRLRTFIVDQKYREALTYLNAIPLNRLTPLQRRVFQGDAAEIVYGMMFDAYKKSNYGEVVKIWEIYRTEYVDKVANDPFINFIVGQSFVKLGLYNRFDKIVENFEKFANHPTHTFPIWVERDEKLKSSFLLEELKVIKDLRLGNYDAVRRGVDRLKEIDSSNGKHYYYQGILSYREENFEQAARSLERFLSLQTRRSVYDPNDVAEMLLAYTDSVYQKGNVERFKRVASAILNDIESFAPEHKYMGQVRERIFYLYIESLAGSTDQDSLIAETKSKEFLQLFPESTYSGRVRYLLGMTLVTNQRSEEGLEVFQALLEDQNISEHIKEMARSEIALMEIKNRNL